MPVRKCSNNKYRIGNGECVFDTEEAARKAYRGYLYKKYGTKASEQEGVDIPDDIDLQTSEGTYRCECLECHYKMSTQDHCRDIKCPKCGGEMRRADRPGIGA